MKSTSCSELAREILDACLAGKVPRRMPRSLVEQPCGSALFGILVEGLADRFDRSLCDAYVRLFAQALAYVRKDVDAGSLASRYERVRKVRPVAGRPHRIFVLSRVTLGADIAVTSVLIAAAKRRFPHAELVFVGPKKNYELFAGDPHIHHAAVEYPGGGLRERLGVWERLHSLFVSPDAVVIDPDSRLTQLGMLPICPEERYYLFESRAFGGDSGCALPELAAIWAAETFGVPGALPYVPIGELPPREPYIAVSLGVGNNSAKRLPDPFEEKLLELLGGTGMHVCIDKGAGGEEGERVARALEHSGVDATVWDGSFAGFARIIAGSRLYAGYDSAGQHVAAAAGVPLISIFAGFPCQRMFERWRPVGPRSRIIRVDQPDLQDVLAHVRDAIQELH